MSGHKLLLVVLTILTCVALSCGREYAWLDSLPQPWTLDPAGVSAVLPEFWQRCPGFDDRLRALVLWRVGTPYGLFMLGEECPPDPDPLLRLDVADCTGLILTTLALAQSRDWSEARANMITIHYKPDAQGRRQATYRSRWHFTADRLTANPATVDITPTLLPADELATATVVLNAKADGGELLDLDWQRPVTLRYIPNDKIDTGLLSHLPAVCGVAFVKSGNFRQGLIFGHEGFVIDGRDLIHASSAAGETVRQDFLEYYFTADGPRFDGIAVFRLVLTEGE